MGAALAAIAVGTAPGYDVAAAGGEARRGLHALQTYLKKHYPLQNLHNRIWMLWASTTLKGLLTSSEKTWLSTQILEKQQASGGWSLGSLGAFARKDVKQDTNPDGYATGLILHVLQLAGGSKDECAYRQGARLAPGESRPDGRLAYRVAQ